MKTFYLISLGLLTMFSIKANAQHFQTIWSGNPYQMMNFVVNSSTIDSVQIEAGDELAVFDVDTAGNEICVGAYTFTGPPSPSAPAMMVAATDDPTTQELDGFTPGDSILYRLWDNSSQLELSSFVATYNTTTPFVDVYTSFGTAIVDVNFLSSGSISASSVYTCPGVVTVPVEVSNLAGMVEFNLELIYNSAELIYNAYQNLNPALGTGVFNLVDNNGSLIMQWNSGTAVTISTGNLIELLYNAQETYSQTLSSLSWNASNSYIIDGNGDTLDIIFTNGMVTIEPLPGDPGNISGASDVCQGSMQEAYAVNTISNATSCVWTLDPSNAGIIYGTGTNISIDFSGNYNGTAVLSVYGSNNCGIGNVSSLNIDVIANPSADAGANADICENNSWNLQGTANHYSSVQWTTSGDGTFDDASILTPVYDPGMQDITNGSVVLSLTVNPLSPCTNTASDDMTLSLFPLPQVNAGTDDTICGYATYYLTGTATNYNAVQWYTSGDGSFSDANILNPLYTPGSGDTTTGSVYLILSAQSMLPCTDNVSDTMMLRIAREPSVYAGPDDAACENAPYALNGTATEYSSVLWNTSGDGTFDDADLLNATYTPGSADLSNGSVELWLEAYPIPPCNQPVSDTLMLNVYISPTADAGSDAFICEDQTIALNGTAENYDTIAWTSSGDGFFDDAGSLTAIYTPGGSDILNGMVDLSLTAYAIAPCYNNAVDQMTLLIQQLPGVYAGNDDSICIENNGYALNATASHYNSVLWSSSGDGTFSDPTLLNPVYYPGSADINLGEVNLSIHVTPLAPCESNVNDEMLLSIIPYPLADAGPNDTICMNTPEYLISGANAQHYNAIVWNTSGDGTFNDPTLLNPIYTPGSADIANGSVFLVLTAQSILCSTSDTDSLQLILSVLPVANAGADDLICETDVYPLYGAANYYSSIEWSTSGDGTFDDPYILNPVYTPGEGDIIAEGVYLSLNAYPNYPCTDVISDDLFLQIQRLPVADAPANDTICMTSAGYAISGATVGNQDAVLWTTSGDGSFSDPGILNPVYFPGEADIANGSVVLTLTAFAISPCVNDSSDSMNLVFALLPTAYAGPDDIACEAQGYQINATAGNYSSIWWYSTGDGIFNDPTSLTPVYIPGEEDGNNGSVNLILFAYAMEPCSGEVSDTLALQVNPIPEVNAGEDNTICANEYYLLSGAAANYESVLWSTPGDGSFDDPTLLNATYMPGQGDIINGMVDITLTAYPLAPCTESAQDMIQLSIEPLPGTPETPSGPELVDVSLTSSTNYLITIVANADDYIWELIPDSAGSIINAGCGCKINWNDPPVSDTAFLSVTAVNNCDSITSAPLIILTYTGVGIVENNGPALVNIVPNPANGQFQLILKGVEEDVNIELLSSNGKLISKENMINLSKERSVKDFDLSNQPKGVYYLRIYNNSLNVVRKVLVQ